ncbi:uncharacterized protein I206_100550 [Kwoniella pini CBS 10737]|uniref:F-box domain-containing protein n=1 Tax=Kwoniella pini CBS 10737 TaxID=1296096 RepID=A0A1B9ICZ3_9TREE|nr:uncharacterized protein I206_00775 [Kwoniella pini CBS 10737]OCF53472.1 hypothetical protein I206_00775 [Kwoniella pini CBS 10737]
MSTSSLLHTALQNLHVSQQIHQQPHTPGSNYNELDSSRGGSPIPFSDGELTTTDDEGDELVQVGKGTRPSTPTTTTSSRGLQLGQRLPRSLGGKNTKDPLRTLPTHISVRIFIQLDVRALARCNRVCKRWHKSSTLNYVWFLHNRALVLPKLLLPDSPGGKTRKVNNEIEFFDPYDKKPRLSSLPQPNLPNSSQPVWTKIESKKNWRNQFKITFKRTDPTNETEIDSRRVDISSLQTSGYNTPNNGHGYKGLGSGNASKWIQDDSDGGGGLSSSEKKQQAREGYKALGGRKSKSKRKMGGELGGKDKGGANDNGRFEAPW